MKLDSQINPNISINKDKSENKFKSLIDFLVNIATAALIFSAVYFFVAQPHQVEGSSMVPNYLDGDYVLTEKVTKSFNGFNRGNVIVFHYPNNPKDDYIKRIIAVPGDVILVQDGNVYLNNQVIQEPYLPSDTITKGSNFLKDGEPYAVKQEEMIVMGDNRKESSDSRQWGVVTQDLVLGKVFFRYWPLSRIGLVGGK